MYMSIHICMLSSLLSFFIPGFSGLPALLFRLLYLLYLLYLFTVPRFDDPEMPAAYREEVKRAKARVVEKVCLWCVPCVLFVLVETCMYM